MIRYILLGFINYHPMSGYDLKRYLDSSTMHFWHAHHSQIYTSLRQMEEEGLLTSQFINEEGQPNRRIYDLTDAGRETLRTWLKQPMNEMSPIKEELLVRIFFSGQRNPQDVVTELQHQRVLHQAKLAVYKNMQSSQLGEEKPTSLERDELFWHATVQLGVRYEEAYLQWLDETIAMVQSL